MADLQMKHVLAAAIAVAVALTPAPPSHAGSGGLGTAAFRVASVIDREDIVLSGRQTVLELLAERSPINRFGVHQPLGVDLRRLAVLINGRRAGPLVDTDTLPLSAVERIEILDDNAVGAQGGDAIGGAVNIVLRKNLDGFELLTSAVQPAEKGGDSSSGSVLWRGAVGSGRMTIGADTFRRGEIRSADRDYSRVSWEPGGAFAGTRGVSAAGNTVFINADRALSIGPCRTEDGYTGTLRNPLGLDETSNTGCGFANANIDWTIIRFEQAGVLVDFDYPLGEDAEVFAHARIVETDSSSRASPSAGVFSFTPSSPADFGGEIGDTFRIAHTFVAHGNRDGEGEADEFRLSAGVGHRPEGSIGYEAQVTAYRYESADTFGNLVSESAIQKAITNGSYDLADPLSSLSTTIRNSSLHLTREYKTDYKELRAVLNGTAAAPSGGDAEWIAGAELAAEEVRYRRDYRDDAGKSYPASDVLGSAGEGFAGKRQRRSIFSELSVPLSGDWDVALTGRGDAYDDVGGALTYRLASRYRLDDRITLRGSWGEGARPPHMITLDEGGSRIRPWVCDVLSHGNSADPCVPRKITHHTVGNSRLDPERSSRVSAGAAADLGPISLSADWFRISISDMPELFSTSAQRIMSLEALGALPDSVSVTRDGDAITIRNSYENLGKEEISGVDLAFEAEWETDHADIDLVVNWLHRTDYKKWVAGVRQPGHVPRDGFHGSLRAGRNDFTVNWGVQARSGYMDAQETGRFRSWINHDLSFDWREPLGLSGAALVGGVLNVGDAGPSVNTENPNSAVGRFDAIRGRTFFVTAKVAF